MASNETTQIVPYGRFRKLKTADNEHTEDSNVDIDEMELALLAQLPDVDEDLSVQQGRGPTTFEPFLRLPYELRSRIWRHALPSRYVSLDVPPGEEGRRSAIPDVMLACTESYRECALLFAPKCPRLREKRGEKDHKCQFCITDKSNFIFPSINDRFYTSYLGSGRVAPHHAMVEGWIGNSRNCKWAKLMYSRLHTLEIRNLTWTMATAIFIEHATKLALKNPPFRGHLRRYFMLQLFRFQNLKPIVCVMSSVRRGISEIDTERDIKEVFGAYLDCHKEAWNDVAPKIEVKW